TISHACEGPRAHEPLPTAPYSSSTNVEEVCMGAEDMRQQRKRPEWVKNIAMLGIGILVYLVAFPAAIYMHENAPQWEALAVFVSLGLGLLPVFWYWRFRRYGWVVAIISGLFLTFSFTAALLHGWELVALALVNVAVIVLVVVMSVYFT